ncbi:MAG: hypothetical protein JNL30_08410 [Rubrivivax sp.]|nr:hypothetical protein [Rubrivivax sp.]
MTTQSLAHVTQETLDNYHLAATQAVAAYRAGSERLVRVMSDAVELQVVPAAAKLAPKAAERVDVLRSNVSTIVVKGLDQVVGGAEFALGRGHEVATAQLSKAAEFTAGIESAALTSGLDTAARLSLPLAKLARVVSGKVAEGATALAGAAGVRPMAEVRKAARKVKAAGRQARKAAAPVVKRARRAAKKAVSAA